MGWGMKKGDIIQISVGGRTSYATINSTPDPCSLHISFDGALCFGGNYLFFNAGLTLDEDGRWREILSGAKVTLHERPQAAALRPDNQMAPNASGRPGHPDLT